jgi:hypothetical protein
MAVPVNRNSSINPNTVNDTNSAGQGIAQSAGAGEGPDTPKEARRGRRIGRQTRIRALVGHVCSSWSDGSWLAPYPEDGTRLFPGILGRLVRERYFAIPLIAFPGTRTKDIRHHDQKEERYSNKPTVLLEKLPDRIHHRSFQGLSIMVYQSL